MDDREAEELLARHNLHVTYGEIRTIKQAIRDGDLLELVESRLRPPGHARRLSHPAGPRRPAEETDPVSKDTFFYLSTESARRPEVARHHQRLDRFDLSGDVFVTEGARSDEFDENWRIAAPFGPYPRELSGTYPFTAEVPDARSNRRPTRRRPTASPAWSN